MNTKNALLLGLILTVSALTATAQTAPTQTACPMGQPGPAWRLTPEQRAERQQKVQATLTELRAKRDNGTLTANEKACLERMEQSGGLCVNGVPRGGGRGGGFGARDGTGPRAQMGLCPLARGNQAAAVTQSSGTGRGPGFGRGWGGGRGRGAGGGFGLRNGTGPRAQTGACPLVKSAPSN